MGSVNRSHFLPLILRACSFFSSSLLIFGLVQKPPWQPSCGRLPYTPISSQCRRFTSSQRSAASSPIPPVSCCTYLLPDNIISPSAHRHMTSPRDLTWISGTRVVLPRTFWQRFPHQIRGRRLQILSWNGRSLALSSRDTRARSKSKSERRDPSYSSPFLHNPHAS